MTRISNQSRSNYLNDNDDTEEKVLSSPPSLSDLLDKILLTTIFILLMGSAVTLPALCLFGSVSKDNMLFNVYRMFIQDTTTFHDIPDVYPIGLWNYCYGFTDISQSQWLCIDMRYGYYLNPRNIFVVQSNSLPADQRISFTNAQSLNLDYSAFDVSVLNYLAFIFLHVSFVFSALYFICICYRGIRRLFKKGQHAYSLFNEASRSTLVFVSLLNVASAVLTIISYKRYNTHFENSGITFEIGKPWQICMWLSVLLNIIAWISIDCESKYRNNLFTRFQIYNSQSSGHVFNPVPAQQQSYSNYTPPSFPPPSHTKFNSH